MISEFQDLSEKIDRLAQMTQSLRSENYLLRQANTLLSVENVDFKHRLIEAQRRVEALLAQLDPDPSEVQDEAGANAPDAAPDASEVAR